MKKKGIIIFVIFLSIILILIGVVFFIFNKSKKLPEVAQEVVMNPALLSWEQATSNANWPKRDSHGFVVYKDKIWVMGGVDGTKRMISPGNVDYGNAQHFRDVWASNDGVTWEQVAKNAPWGDRRSMQAVNFNNKIWLIGGWGPELGNKNDVWSSTDGVKWKIESASANWPAREGHQVLVFKNKLWLMGGVGYAKQKVFNDVWSSEDGVNWTKITKSAGWVPRWDFAATVFQNKLWITGGMDLTQKMFNDVWSSADGVNWVLVTDNPPFLTRQGCLVNYKGKLWLIGRLNDITNNGPNDVWYSENGVDWQKTVNDPLWTGREDFGAVIFKDKIWIFGGMDKEWKWKNDVWYSM